MRYLNQATIPSYTLNLMLTIILSVKCISSMPTTLLDAYTVHRGGMENNTASNILGWVFNGWSEKKGAELKIDVVYNDSVIQPIV